MSARETAFAKINLALHVRRRRDDGYHEIETLFAFCEDGDVLTSRSPAESGTQREKDAWAPASAGEQPLQIDGPFAEGLDAGPANLVHRAATALQTEFAIDQPWALRLEKNLPIAAGIGGGSADAAAALRLLCRRWGIDPDDPRVGMIAAALGADVPACLRSRAAFGIGRGDELVRVEGLAGTPVLLVNPRRPVATGPVFAAWDGVDGGPLDPADPWAGRNDLEVPARRLLPAIDEVLAFLGTARGATLSRMSGSGATCFALFADDAARDAAAASIPAGWWRLATRLRG